MATVASKNMFALLNDEDASPPSTPKAAPAKAATVTEITIAPASGGQRARASGPASRGGRYYQRGGAKGNPNRDSEQPGGDSDAPKDRADGRGRGRGGRGGRGRGDRPGRGRQYDRHSATGLVDSDKKVHQGWGGDQGPSELTHETQGATDAAGEVPEAAVDWTGAAAVTDDNWAAADTSAAPAADDWATPAADTSGDAAAPAAPNGDGAEGETRRPRRDRDDEDENLLTLDEYLSKQGTKISADLVPQLEGRKANEGADTSALFKGATKHTKGGDEDEAYFAGKAKSAPKAKSKKEDKVFIEIDAQFERPAGSRGGRGGRGGDRGGRGGDRGGGRGRGGGDRDRGDRPPRGRGRGRGDAPTAPAASAPSTRSYGNVDVGDTTAFPSLA